MITGANNTNKEKHTAPTLAGDWIKDKIGKPIFWIGVGFLTCKILDVYLEGQKTRRIKS